jgi:hypothetical protein
MCLNFEINSEIFFRLFVRTIPMEGKEVDDALRLFQTFFRMPVRYNLIFHSLVVNMLLL